MINLSTLIEIVKEYENSDIRSEVKLTGGTIVVNLTKHVGAGDKVRLYDEVFRIGSHQLETTADYDSILRPKLEECVVALNEATENY